MISRVPSECRFVGIIILFVAMCTVGCASEAAVMVPVGGFRTSASSNRLGGALDELTQRLMANLRLPENQPIKVAVLDFTTSGRGSCAAAARIAAGLTSRLFQTGKIRVIERQQLDRLLEEQKMASTDFYDPSSAAKLGGLLGASAFVVGTLDGAGTDYEIHGRIVSVETSDVWSTADTTVRRGEIDSEGTCD